MSNWYEHDDDHVAVDGVFCVRDTDKALLIKEGLGDEDGFWCPKSVVHEDSEVWKDQTDGTLIIKRWLAEKNNWL